ncbi:MAG: UDP-N-acetylmuramoyl-L-alanine--D-glutamate ligase, partial [Anaerolineales bacterium]|nr:UDP-N-acetylmuramoyl-L-alanine--D-glutamate ligase [Anaerolineales bacterium]
WVGGNIGQPLISDVAQMKAGDLVVQELSSFQLEIWTQSPQIAAVLNITPNHLDRHKTMAGYTEAKSSIVRFQSVNDSAILCADDDGAMALKPLINGRLRTFSMIQPVVDGAFLRDEQIWLRDQTGQETAVCPLEAIQLRGRHNIMNVLAACTIADTAAVPVAAMRTAIAEFKGVEHRLELVRTLKGVQYINDSIATAPERALAALAAFDEPLVLLAGGRDKKMNWEVWAQTVTKRTKAVILFGDLAELLEEKLAAVKDGQTAVQRVNTLAEAVKTAAQQATSGDIVLLSPGGTSYDAFKDFVERGELFRDLVRNL